MATRSVMRFTALAIATVFQHTACQDVTQGAPDLDGGTCSDTGCDTDTGTGPCEEWACEPDEDMATCEAAATEAECEEASAAIRPDLTDDWWHYCSWTDFVEILPGASHSCSFGEVRSRCIYIITGEEGCVGSSPACGEGTPYAPEGWRSVHYACDDGKLFMTILPCGTSSCTYGDCLWSENAGGVLTEGIDECECACDPDIPL